MKSAIVTGASSGIGLAVSQMLLKHGYQVFGVGRNFSDCPLINEGEMQSRFIPLQFDLINTQRLPAFIGEIKKRCEGSISCLVNGAGVGYYGLHETLNAQKIHEMVAVNLETPLVLTQLLLRDLKKESGIVIHISSVTALHASPHGCAYGATKAGLSSFGLSLFEEARKYGVRVVTIHPDMTSTNFYRNADFCEGEAADTRLEPAEVARAVEIALNARDGLVLSEITLQPQKRQIRRKPPI